MKNAKQTYFKDRAVFYSTFPIRDQAQKGEWNFKLEAVYCVALLEFNFNRATESSEIDELVESQSYYHRVQLRHNQKNNKSICQPIFHHPASAKCHNRPAMMALYFLA